jgi:hypothetical protein
MALALGGARTHGGRGCCSGAGRGLAQADEEGMHPCVRAHEHARPPSQYKPQARRSSSPHPPTAHDAARQCCASAAALPFGPPGHCKNRREEGSTGRVSPRGAAGSWRPWFHRRNGPPLPSSHCAVAADGCLYLRCLLPAVPVPCAGCPTPGGHSRLQPERRQALQSRQPAPRQRRYTVGGHPLVEALVAWGGGRFRVECGGGNGSSPSMAATTLRQRRHRGSCRGRGALTPAAAATPRVVSTFSCLP